jgi:hypothetical protein
MMVRKTKKQKMSDLAVEFGILQDQIRDSSGKVRKELEKERDNVIKKYKKLKGIL